MSRQIDLSKPLSEEDREYLDSRGRNDLIERNDRQYGNAEALYEVQNDGHTGDVDPFTNDEAGRIAEGTQPMAQAANPLLTLEAQNISDLEDEDKDPNGIVSTVPEPTQQAGDAVNEGGEDGDYDDNYDDETVWSYADLQEEAKSREGVKATGKRAEIIAALRADDQADEAPENPETTES